MRISFGLPLGFGRSTLYEYVYPEPPNPTLLDLVTGGTMVPATGEFVYDTIPYRGARSGASVEEINRHTAVSDGAGGYTSGAVTAGQLTDFVRSVQQIITNFPNLKHISLVVSWFLNTTDLGDSSLKVYPTTTYKYGSFEKWNGSAWVSDQWRCSGLTQADSVVFEPIMFGTGFAYSGTPSDQSIVRAIQYLKSLGLRVTLYPFLMINNSSYGWRGDLSASGDKSSWWDNKISEFFGPAAMSDFTLDYTNLTVGYSRATTDFTYRRFIGHLAHLAVLAGGVDAILAASEMRGLEKHRGASWLRAGTSTAAGQVWDYPWQSGICTLADNIRTLWDSHGLTRNKDAASTEPMNLIGYAGDWSSYSGQSYSDENCFTPHMDQVWSHESFDFVGIDYYPPVSDYTSGTTGATNRDIANWSSPAPDEADWPPTDPNNLGLGLSGTPSIYDLDYLKWGLEHGEQADYWYANNDVVAGPSTDPHGGTAKISLPASSDRLNQNRNAYGAGQQITARKKWRLWAKTQHKGIWTGSSGWEPQGEYSTWTPGMKPIVFTEVGFASMSRSTNAPNMFPDYKSSVLKFPPWCEYNESLDGPLPDNLMQERALQAFFEHVRDTNELIDGNPLFFPELNAAWTLDARPYPDFPGLEDIWGDFKNRESGHWIGLDKISEV